jgi:DNA-binding NtrC family response regulator
MAKEIRVLIADDDKLVRESLKSILINSNGFVCDMAADGMEAIKKVKDNFYDLLLLDLEMPRVSGYDVLQISRAIYPGLPVIFITGKANAKKVEVSIAKHKLNGFIEKPFDPKEVIDLIKASLKISPKLA